jgi:hypothetical protein
MGRFAAESSIAEASLRKPIERYFHELQEILAGALREAQADGEIAKRLDASELALMLITVVQRGSSFRGFIAIAMPSIEPQRWPSRCSNRCRTAEQDEAGFGVDTRGVRLFSAEVLVSKIPGERPTLPTYRRQITGASPRIICFELKKAPGS